MVRLRRATGPTALLDIAFEDGNILKAFRLIGIRRLLRRGAHADAITLAEAYVLKSGKARARAERGRPLKTRECRLVAGELFYRLGASDAALEGCILPEVEEMIREEDYRDAGVTLDAVLRAEPECARALALRKQVPAAFG